MTLLAPPRPWTEHAACVGLSDRQCDWWAACTDEELDEPEKDHQTYAARLVCSTCPVRLDCATDALGTLPRAGEHTMRGGLTPHELSQVARSLGLPWRREAVCGTRSKYVSGCRCADCRNAHRVYEHERRLQVPLRRQVRPRGPWTPRTRVVRSLGHQPSTARAISRRTGIKTSRVRDLLAELEQAGKAMKAGTHDGAPAFTSCA